ncbi:response regulator transcription factor [Desulfofustis glycolicus]|uniref:Two-component system, OmpR family, phosphate regulon response regulator PhoB n=1 Tax=Desulfofustis glycolicus DSM 9705 TaxID=1121409 RepID=A0A1M5V8U6_9BACT|nr:response regulator transcription factor [Desulfofustis glycolicus]MCB2214894.1 response regulator transcription factor [Desulfobulbaceae bacterium]SHH71692.1 two-component system, OmpR family, phosphate regulon response regulator PhoB [Desulfofustis glycolicus DSM 9705]
MGKITILVVEDEAAIQQLVSYNLIKAGFHVTCADSGEEALECLLREDIDCVLLDLMLPGMSGLEVCEAIRSKNGRQGHHIPIIMLTAKGEEEDVVSGLDYGADDYITKPFSPKVLIARIKAVLRRGFEKTQAEADDDQGVIILDDLEINKGRHEVKLGKELLHLTMTEFGILALLAGKPGWVFTRQQIIDSVRGYDFLITPRAIDVQVFGLRKKLGSSGRMIETVRGVGYRFRSDA